MKIRIFLCIFIVGVLAFQQDTRAATDPLMCEIDRLLDPTVVCENTSTPIVTLSGPATVNIIQGGKYTEAGATWTDSIDGSGVISAPTSGWVDVNTPGTYTLQYKYTNSTSKTSNIVTRTVKVGNSNPPPSSTSLPAMTWLYGESLSTLSQSNDGTYNIIYNATNKFFRAEWLAKYSSKERVIRITTNRNAYYVQTPIRTDGSWTVFDTTTPGWVLSAFLQQGMNTLTISYYNKDTKTFITSGAQKITIYVQ